MELNNPNYYAILTANVRYDKRLKPAAKLLYAELTALCHKEGFCWAGNDYFANLYEMSERNIQNLLKNLVDADYIRIEIDQKNQNPRRIFLLDLTKKISDLTKKISPAHEKNFTPSIYSINNTINMPGTGINFLISEYPTRFEQEFLMKYEKQFNDETQFNRFLEDFNDEVESQGKKFNDSLFGMLKKYARNWIDSKKRNALRVVKDNEMGVDRPDLKRIG